MEKQRQSLWGLVEKKVEVEGARWRVITDSGGEGNNAFCAELGCSGTDGAGIKGRTTGRSLGHKSLEMCQEGVVLSGKFLGDYLWGSKKSFQ